VSDTTCIRCEKIMRNYAQTGFHPCGGLAFHTRGHYGSAYFDPMNGDCLEIVICDECVEAAEKAGRVYRFETGSREVLT
jgi:hypothetical protein